MTKKTCDKCGKKNDSMHTISECTNCYIKGAEKELNKGGENGY